MLDAALLDALTRPQRTLPAIEQWLLTEVWTERALAEAGGDPTAYLLAGETRVNAREVFLTHCAPSYFAELREPPVAERTIPFFLDRAAEGAVVIFDGVSLREVPRLLELARASRRPVVEIGTSRSAVPSETTGFVRHRLGFGLPGLGPSQLEGRRELRERDIAFHFFRSPSHRPTVRQDARRHILWSRFPDLKYSDSDAAGGDLFGNVWQLFEPVWRETVQALPPQRPVLVTSDHGYVFFGPGLSDRNLDGTDRVLHRKRHHEFAADEPLPTNPRGVWIDAERRVGVLAGRCQNRPQGATGSQSLYRHGGLSLMEVLTPWIVLGPVGQG